MTQFWIIIWKKYFTSPQWSHPIPRYSIVEITNKYFIAFTIKVTACSCSNCRIFCSFWQQSRLQVLDHAADWWAVETVLTYSLLAHNSLARHTVGTDFQHYSWLPLQNSQDVSSGSAEGDIRHFGRSQLTHILCLTRWKSWKNSQLKRDNRRNQPQNKYWMSDGSSCQTIC